VLSRTIGGAEPHDPVVLKASNAHLTRDADPRVAEYFNDLTIRALKSLNCTTAQSRFTTEEANAVSGETLDFDPGVGITTASVVEYVNTGNEQLKATLTTDGYPVSFYNFATDTFAAATINRATRGPRPSTARSGHLILRCGSPTSTTFDCLVPTGSR
jgi:hypothetical protein